MKVVFKREIIPIVKPFDEVVVELLQQPKTVEKEITLNDGTKKSIIDLSILVKPVKGKFESVTEKVKVKVKSGEIIEAKKYDAAELGDKVVMKIPNVVYDVLSKLWESKEIGEGTRIKIIAVKKQGKTYINEIAVLDDNEVSQEKTEENLSTKK